LTAKAVITVFTIDIYQTNRYILTLHFHECVSHSFYFYQNQRLYLCNKIKTSPKSAFVFELVKTEHFLSLHT